MTADLGTLQRLPHLMPQGLVRELAYTGRKMYADEALRVGLVNNVFKTQEEMLEHVMDVAASIARQSPIAVNGCKEMINFTRDHTVAEGLDYVATWQMGMFRPSEMMKVLAAKAQRTAPDFEELPVVNKNPMGD